MKTSARTALFTACGAAVIFAGGGVAPTYAACVSGAQCEANGFAESPAANDSFNAIGTNPENAALKAINGGAITGSNLTINATTGFTPYGAYVDSNGQITLTDPATSLTGFRGVRAQGGGSFTMTDGKIDTSDVAVEMFSDGTVTLTDVDIERNTGSATAIRLGSTASNASFTMTGGSIDSVVGAIDVSGSDNQATFSGVTIDSGSAMTLAGSNQNTTLTLNGGTTLTHSGGTAAIQSNRGTLFLDDAHITSTNGPGISVLTSTGLANMDAQNFSVTLTNLNPGTNPGIQLGVNSLVKLDNGSITVHGNGARGIWNGSTLNNALSADAVTITMHGDDAQAMFAHNSTSTLTNSHVVLHGDNAIGVFADSLNTGSPVINMTGGTIIANGDNNQGARAARGGEVNLDGVAITTTHANSFGLTTRLGNATATFKNGSIDSQGHGVVAQQNSVVTVDGSDITSSGADGHGVRVQLQANAGIGSGSTITAAGVGGVGLAFVGRTENNTITIDASTVATTGTSAMAAGAFGGNNQLNASNSVLSGDRLVVANTRNDPDDGNTYHARLDFNANNSVLRGHAAVSAQSTLRMNLANGTDWTLTPSAGGVTRSDVTFLNVNNSRVVFDPASAQRQTLVVGSGDTGGNPAVYSAVGNARITLNTLLNDGGALANQTTDRVVINGNASGTTLLSVNALAGSVGADTGGGASAGISLVQVYGNATSNSFALTGGYVPIGAYEYQLYAFDPTASDTAQRDPTANLAGPFWDFRLLSGAGGGKTPLAQIPSYLVAPNALFQARLLDIATLHQRVGAVLPADKGNRDFFLRTYGGDSRYHGNRSVSQYGFNADTRYHAVQGGGNFYGVDTTDASLRVGVAASVGDLSFTPNRANNARKTRMDVWSVSPTFTWQRADGAYVDALVSTGQFKGDIANRNGITTTLEGKSHAASVEAGVPFPLAGFTVEPQLQTVYQRLKFDNTRDADGVAVQLGTLTQWTVRTGAKVGTVFEAPAGGSVQFYGKAHVAHHFGDGKKVRLSDRFRLGKSGTVLETGLGIAATFAQGHATVYADVTRQTRIGRAGHQGWSANLGARVRF